MQQQCKHCLSLLQQLVSYKEQSLIQKEQMKKEIEKYRQQLEKFTGKVDKRIQTRIKEERNVNNHRLQELQTAHQEESNKFRGLLGHKDRIIDEMRQLVRVLQSQKRQLIQNNTKVLVQLSQGIDIKEQQPSQAIDHNYKQLMRMYQYLIEQNNQLKKQIYLLQKQNLNYSHHSQISLPNKNQSFLIKEQKSLNNSQYKPKSVYEQTKQEPPISIKNPPTSQKPKDKLKKPTSTKHKK